MKKYIVLAIMAISLGSATSYAQTQVPTKKEERAIKRADKDKRDLNEAQSKVNKQQSKVDKKEDKIDKKERKMHKKQRRVDAKQRTLNKELEKK